MLDVSIPTILSLLVRVGEGCAAIMDQTLVNLPTERLELDEIWAYVGKKQRHVSILDLDPESVGDTWTYVAIDSDTKLVPAHLVGKRTAENTNAFVEDLASRLSKRVQISTDGLAMYVEAIHGAFGGNVDYAQIVKSYEAEHAGPGRYSPPKVTETQKTPIFGEPVEELVSTSYVERQNLTMRMQIRRMTRLTNAFSKKLRNHKAATALHFAHYNFVRRHQTLRTSPAMAAGVTERLWSTEDLVDLALRTGAP
jgi:IS1 family transposase